MIVVIADDLSGAAEIGGIGLRYGLKTEIVTTPYSHSKPELLVISTDTRSMTEHQAMEKTREITGLIQQIRPSVIFKKVDSVLRGHIMPELRIHLEMLGLDSALLVPANPSLGRIFCGGHYYVHNEPIHLTSFSHDPEFAVRGSKAHEMLRVNEDEIKVKKTGDILSSPGIMVGESITDHDLAKWINKAKPDTLLAGGAGFFTALLDSLNLQPKSPQKIMPPCETPYLLVCGSTHDKSRQQVKKLKKNGGPVSYMPDDVLAGTTAVAIDNWANEIVSLIIKNKKAIIAINEDSTRKIIITAAVLREKKAAVVEQVFKKTGIKELLIEGGSTAAAIINRLNFNRLFPEAELNAGVIKMKVDRINDLHLTLKPGSYDWPADSWNF